MPDCLQSTDMIMATSMSMTTTTAMNIMRTRWRTNRRNNFPGWARRWV